MSDTPRMDEVEEMARRGVCLPKCDSFAHEDLCPVANEAHVVAEGGRTLERENNQLRDELAKWKSGCEANAADAADCHRKSDERRLEIIQLRGVLRQCAEALQGIDEINDNYFSREELVCDRDRELYNMLHKALALPAVQNALKDNKQQTDDKHI